MKENIPIDLIRNKMNKYSQIQHFHMHSGVSNYVSKGKYIIFQVKLRVNEFLGNTFSHVTVNCDFYK